MEFAYMAEGGGGWEQSSDRPRYSPPQEPWVSIHQGIISIVTCQSSHLFLFLKEYLSCSMEENKPPCNGMYQGEQSL
jgi:hypothetical protein